MMNPLDQKIRDYYQDRTLSQESVEQILASSALISPPWWKQPAWMATAGAAVAALFIACVVIISNWEPSITSKITEEVAANHKKKLDPEVFRNSYTEVQAALPKLTFSIVPQRSELLSGMELLGGRYCSIQGELAAQLDLRAASGQPCTLYVTPLTEKLSAAKEGVYRVNGAEIQIWQDAHRLFALAR